MQIDLPSIALIPSYLEGLSMTRKATTANLKLLQRKLLRLVKCFRYLMSSMALAISLSHSQGEQFTPGSMVLGVVKLTNHEDQIIKSLSIDFKGLSSVFLNQNYGDMGVSRSNAGSKAYLFSRHLDLYSGEGLHHKGTHVWPFAFRIPLFAAPRLIMPGSKELFYPRKPWKGDFVLERHLAHPLPPSIQMSGKFVCSVRYCLEAVLTYRSSAVTKPKKLRASHTISVRSLEMSLHASTEGDWSYVKNQHILCSASAQSWKQYLRQPWLILHRKEKHHVPDVQLCFSVFLPKEIQVKATQMLSIPVACTMIHLSEAGEQQSQTVDRNLNLVVHSFKFTLFQHAWVRAGSHDSSSVKKILTRKGTCIVPVSHTSSSNSCGAENSPDHIVNLSNVVDMSIPESVLSPDFSTYNITRFHSLEIRFYLSYGGRKNQFVLRDVPIRVISQSSETLQRRLSEGLESDDEHGCNLVGICWRNYRFAAVSADHDALGLASDSDGDLCPETPPPVYTA